MSKSGAKTQTHYDTLGVRPTASPQQIRRAFRDLSKLYHPDTTALPAAEATEKFQQLNEAYAVLSSPDRRWQYDQHVGYSRISVMQPMQSLRRETSTVRPKEKINNMYLDPTDRPLSPGEIFALFILGITFIGCLVLVFTVALTKGEVVINPTDLPAPQTAELTAPKTSTDVPLTPSPATVDERMLRQAAPSTPAPSLPQSSGSDHPKDLPVSPPTWL
jgi:hypothetical protein